MKGKIEAEACIGCGLCVQMAPQIYVMEGDKAVMVSDEIQDENVAAAKSAAEQCPTNAIVIS